MRNLLLNDHVSRWGESGGGGYKSITGVNSSWFSSYPFALDTSCEIKKKFQMNLNLHLDKLLLIYWGGGVIDVHLCVTYHRFLIYK